ncbi:hypothetical protein Tco_0008658 [Tanacetum coccineum]
MSMSPSISFDPIIKQYEPATDIRSNLLTSLELQERRVWLCSKRSEKSPKEFLIDFTPQNLCKKTVECVACLLGRWNGSRGTEKTTRRKSKQVALSLVRVAGIRRRKRQEENEETTRCEHYGGGSSNRVVLDVDGEEAVGVELETTLVVTRGGVGVPGKMLEMVTKEGVALGRD